MYDGKFLGCILERGGFKMADLMEIRLGAEK